MRKNISTVLIGAVLLIGASTFVASCNTVAGAGGAMYRALVTRSPIRPTTSRSTIRRPGFKPKSAHPFAPIPGFVRVRGA